MLDGLEAADLAAELYALLRVAGGELEHRLHGAQLFRGERHLRDLQTLRDRSGAGIARGEHRRRRGRIEREPRIAAGEVHGRESLHGESARVAIDRDERQTVARPVVMSSCPSIARDHDEVVRDVAVEHEGRVAAQHRTRGAVDQLDAHRLRSAGVVGGRERRDALAGGDARQQRIARVRSGRLQQHPAGETDGCQQRSAVEAAAGLLEQQRELDHAEPAAAHRLGKRKTGPTELARDGAPKLGVVRLGRRHLLAQARDVGASREELARRLADHQLVFGQRELHVRSPRLSSAAGAAQAARPPPHRPRTAPSARPCRRSGHRSSRSRA